MNLDIQFYVLPDTVCLCVLCRSETWENIKENTRNSAKESLGLPELKKHKLWFDKECVGFLDHRKQAKMQSIQDPSRNNVDNLNNVRRDANRHFRRKRRNI